MTSATMQRWCESPVVRSRSMQSVAMLDRGVEAERVVGRTQVVVDGLRHADDVDAVFRESVRGGQGALAADRDDAVDAMLCESLRDVLGAAARAVVGVGAAGAEDRTALPGQALHLMPGERHEVAVDDSAPAVADPDELQVVGGRALEHDAADDRVQAGAIAAAGQDADLHGGRPREGRGWKHGAVASFDPNAPERRGTTRGRRKPDFLHTPGRNLSVLDEERRRFTEKQAKKRRS